MGQQPIGGHRLSIKFWPHFYLAANTGDLSSSETAVLLNDIIQEI